MTGCLGGGFQKKWIDYSPLGLQLSLSIRISEYIQDFKVRVSVGALMTWCCYVWSSLIFIDWLIEIWFYSITERGERSIWLCTGKIEFLAVIKGLNNACNLLFIHKMNEYINKQTISYLTMALSLVFKVCPSKYSLSAKPINTDLWLI